MWQDLDPFLAEVRSHWRIPTASRLEALHAAFPDPKFVYLSRRDKLRQGISLYRARVTDGWVAGMAGQRHVTPAYNAGMIRAAVDEITSHDLAWRRFFRDHALDALPVVYEDLAASPRETMTRLLAYLDLSLPQGVWFEPRRTAKQADALSEEWVARLTTRRTTCAEMES
jgi:LPS sulfotransferase NodH